MTIVRSLLRTRQAGDGLPVAVRQRLVSRPLTDGSRPARPGRQTRHPDGRRGALHFSAGDPAESAMARGTVSTLLPEQSELEARLDLNVSHSRRGAQLAFDRATISIGYHKDIHFTKFLSLLLRRKRFYPESPRINL